jgi:prephenate dehydrogenase
VSEIGPTPRAAAGAIRTLHVVGSGLIGTSIGLAARAAAVDVTLADRDERRLAGAVRRGAGRASPPEPSTELVVVAVPPGAVAEAVSDVIRRGIGATVTHVTSVQAQPLIEIERLIGQSDRLVGGHPVAGREQSGPDAASADLFRDRAWVICPATYSAPEAVARVEALARICGARPTRMHPADHDELLARLSHVPQLVASGLAAAVSELPAAAVALAGSGLRDTTRLADSDVRLWAEIISANPTAVATALRAVLGPLDTLADVLSTGDPDAAAKHVTELLRRGRAGRDKLPGKHGQRPTAWATVSVVVPDRPGALAELLAAVADHGVNLEDLRVEHAPGQPEGAAELAVAPAAQQHLAEALGSSGWSVSLGTPADR